MIAYYIQTNNPRAHLVEIRMVITDPVPTGQELWLPTWIPGSYLIRDFAQHVITMDAFEGRENELKSIKIQKTNSNTWACEPITGSPLTLIYTIYAADPSVRGAHLDDEHFFFNGSSLFLAAAGKEDQPCRVHLAPRIIVEQATRWRVATSLHAVTIDKEGYGWYEANSYEELIDHPVEIGHFETVEFMAGNIPHRLVATGGQDGDLERIARDVKKICTVHLDLFQAPPPFTHYLFLLTVCTQAYGGLEHRCSSALQIQRECLPIKGDISLSTGYISLLGLISHEYFHAWNVKRIKPDCFVPYALHDKSYTTQLWFFEGATSYYDDLALVRSGIIDVDQYLDLLAISMTKLMRNPGRKRQTLAQSSFDAWIKFYKPNENSINAQVSYYLKGSLLMLAIDLLLRVHTNHKLTLDTVMNQLWQEYGQPVKGVPEGKIEAVIEALGGKRVAALLHQGLHCTQELPLEELLTEFGLKIGSRAALNQDDNGGKCNDKPQTSSFLLGCLILKTQGKIVIAQVFSERAAEKSGLCALDEIITINHIRVDVQSFDKILKRLQPGQTVLIHFFRDNRLKKCSLTIEAPSLDTVQIDIKKELSIQEKNNLDKWLAL